MRVTYADIDIIFHAEKNTNLNSYLLLPAQCISESFIKIKINLNFYFDTFFWYLKRFYEGLKGLHKTFCSTSKKCKNFFSFSRSQYFLFVQDRDESVEHYVTMADKKFSDFSFAWNVTRWHALLCCHQLHILVLYLIVFLLHFHYFYFYHFC